jgi:serine protease Do
MANHAHIRPRVHSPYSAPLALAGVLLAMLTLGLAGCATVPKEFKKPVVPIDSREDAIEQFFTGRALDPVEGIWKTESGHYEVAIVRNTFGIKENYDYLGLIVHSDKSSFHGGQIKLLLEKSASGTVFPGKYLNSSHQAYGTAYELVDGDVLKANLYFGLVQIVRLYPDQSHQGGTGTGFYVTDKLVVTNHHVIDGASEINVGTGNDLTRAEVVMRDRANDLAILKVEKSGACLPLAESLRAASGDPVYVLGYPLSGLLSQDLGVSEGLINNTFGIQDDPRMYQVSVPIQPGNSGSPVLNNRGEVIGVASSSMNNAWMEETYGSEAQNVNFAVKLAYLNTLLTQIDHTPCSAERPRGSLTAREIRERLQSGVVLVESKP